MVGKSLLAKSAGQRRQMKEEGWTALVGSELY